MSSRPIFILPKTYDNNANGPSTPSTNLFSEWIKSKPKNIKHLDCPNCKLYGYANLSSFKQLTRIDFKKNNITGINLSENYNLSKVDLSFNFLTEINLRNNINLFYLNLANNKIKEIDLIDNIKLTQLDLSNNLLKNVERIFLDNKENIYYLNLANNKIKSLKIDFSNNKFSNGFFVIPTIDLSDNNLLELKLKKSWIDIKPWGDFTETRDKPLKEMNLFNFKINKNPFLTIFFENKEEFDNFYGNFNFFIGEDFQIDNTTRIIYGNEQKFFWIYPWSQTPFLNSSKIKKEEDNFSKTKTINASSSAVINNDVVVTDKMESNNEVIENTKKIEKTKEKEKPTTKIFSSKKKTLLFSLWLFFIPKSILLLIYLIFKSIKRFLSYKRR